MREQVFPQSVAKQVAQLDNRRHIVKKQMNCFQELFSKVKMVRGAPFNGTPSDENYLVMGGGGGYLSNGGLIPFAVY